MQKLTYKSLELQTYLKSPIFDHESATMLFALRTRTVRGIRNYFRGMFNNVDCPLGCGNIDTIQNVLTCPVLINNMSCNSITESKVKYKDIFSESK